MEVQLGRKVSMWCLYRSNRQWLNQKDLSNSWIYWFRSSLAQTTQFSMNNSFSNFLICLYNNWIEPRYSSTYMTQNFGEKVIPLLDRLNSTGLIYTSSEITKFTAAGWLYTILIISSMVLSVTCLPILQFSVPTIKLLSMILLLSKIQ
jgi:hypothetical protein